MTQDLVGLQEVLHGLALLLEGLEALDNLGALGNQSWGNKTMRKASMRGGGQRYQEASLCWG